MQLMSEVAVVIYIYIYTARLKGNIIILQPGMTSGMISDLA